MARRNALAGVLLLVTFLSGYACAALSRAHAEPQPAFDRSLVERLIRAQEESAREQEGQRRALEAIAREIERSRR
ncbi:MAG TPA: hypothetical protein VFN67_23280 [Polyangiales bacterium]|nr:hypothetical protein [Polyangiales bacterium]